MEMIGTLGEIDFGATGVKEIIQNVKTIILTTKFSVPLDRNFGIDASLVDLPINIAKARLTVEIIEAVAKYEPRAEIEVLGFTATLEGKLTPRLEVKIIG